MKEQSPNYLFRVILKQNSRYAWVTQRAIQAAIKEQNMLNSDIWSINLTLISSKANSFLTVLTLREWKWLQD